MVTSVAPSDDAVALPSTPRRLDILQLYRGIGATLVVLYHLTWYGGQDPPFLQWLMAWIPSLPDGKVPGFFLFGHSGVDLFFTLSGFVMVWGYGRDAGNVRRLWPFLKARFTRIYPTYWAVFLLTLPFYFVYPDVNQRVLQRDALLRGVFLYGTGPSWVVPPAGTLPYELALYLFFTLLLVAGWAVFLPALVVWCALIEAQLNGWWRVGNYPIWLAPAMVEFCLGCLGAVFVLRVRPRVSAWWLWLVIALCLVVGMYDSVAVLNGWHHSIRNFALPYFLLVTVGAAYELSGRRRYPWLLMLLGEASYSIYLTHYYLIWEVNGRLGHYAIVGQTLGRDGMRLLVFVIVMAIGVAFWAIVERPLIRVSRRLLGSGA